MTLAFSRQFAFLVHGLPVREIERSQREKKHDDSSSFMFSCGSAVPAGPLDTQARRGRSYPLEDGQVECRGRLQGAVARTDAFHIRIPDNREFSYELKRWQVDRRGQSPVLHARTNVDWLTGDPEIFACIFPRLYDGILQDTFNQKA